MSSFLLLLLDVSQRHDGDDDDGVQASTSSGRRHSVVTISRVPQTLFGRNRRESFAAFASSGDA